MHAFLRTGPIEYSPGRGDIIHTQPHNTLSFSFPIAGTLVPHSPSYPQTLDLEMKGTCLIAFKRETELSKSLVVWGGCSFSATEAMIKRGHC